MAASDKDEALKRLGGGRWQTRDGRFTIEPQGGSWVVVDGEQTDDLGLPLVRGPFGSLGAARDAIDEARSGDAPVSPLAGKLEEAADRPRPTRERPEKARRAVKGPARPAAPHGEAGTPSPTRRGRAPAVPASPPEVKPPPTRRGRAPAVPASPPEVKPSPTRRGPPSSPPEPDWIGTLRPTERMAARALIARLDDAGIPDAEVVARAEVVGGEPAIARVAVRRAVAAVIVDGGRADRIAARIVGLLAEGGDEALGVRWRLVDEDGRPLGDALADS